MLIDRRLAPVLLICLVLLAVAAGGRTDPHRETRLRPTATPALLPSATLEPSQAPQVEQPARPPADVTPVPTYPAYQLVFCQLGPDGFVCVGVTPSPSPLPSSTLSAPATHTPAAYP